MSKDKQYVASINLVAKFLEKHPQTVKEWLREGAPPKTEDGYDVLGWADWMQANKGGVTDNDTEAGLKRQHLRLKCDKLRFEIETDKGKWILRQKVEQDTERMIAQTKTVLLSLPNRIGAKFGIEAKKDSQVIIDEALQRLEANPLGENEPGTVSGEKSMATPAV